MNTKTITFQRLSHLAHADGLRVLRTTELAPLLASVKALETWQESGFAGEMRYMGGQAKDRAELLKFLPSARSAVSFALFYSRQAHPPLEIGHGRVARYAWGLDYHTVFPGRLERLVRRVAEELGPIEARVYSDAVPLLERALAQRAGVGFVGNNTLLIRPGEGSFFLLGEIFWNIDVVDQPEAPKMRGCGTCRRCLTDCPTGALVANRVLDARLCLAYLNIEKRGMLSHQERKALGEWVFGCDICQEVCPFNHAPLKRAAESDAAELDAKQGVGPLLKLSEVLSIRSVSQWKQRFGKTALERARRAGLIRNAACVAVNMGYADLAPELSDAALHDPAPTVRATALWAVVALAQRGILGQSLARALQRKVRQDISAEMQTELRAIELGNI
jgi:epoxyqueuosine reductase